MILERYISPLRALHSRKITEMAITESYLTAMCLIALEKQDESYLQINLYKDPEFKI